MTKVCLLYDRIRPDEKLLIEACKRKQVTLKLVDCKRTVFDASNSSKPVDFEVGIQRCVSYLRYLHVNAILEKMGVKLVNSFEVALTCGNKLLTTIALEKANIPGPKTKIAFSVDSALEALNELGYPAILKPLIGSWGRLVALLKDPKSARSILESWDQLGSSWYKVYYLQQYVATLPRDIRCVVVGDRVVAAIYRTAPPDEWRSNLSRGGRAEKCEVSEEINELGVKASEAVGGGVLGVDMMETEDGLVVHEVNHNVEFRRTIAPTGVHIPYLIIDYALGLAEK
ncbi:MAG: lysine biosynthesis protein LysX [Candidatus Bathyarchaeia archaeon]